MKNMECDENWIMAFEKEKKNILMILGFHAVAIEHFRNTTRLRTEVKPIIDIFIGVLPFRGLSFYQGMFSLKDYSYTQTDANGKYLFKKYENGIWRHNLHIIPYDEQFYSLIKSH